MLNKNGLKEFSEILKVDIILKLKNKKSLDIMRDFLFLRLGF